MQMEQIEITGNTMIKTYQPAYLRIKEEITERIHNGEFNTEGRIPAERILSRDLNVSPSTISKAVSLLVQEGLLNRGTTRQGTYVAAETGLKTALMLVYSKGHVYSDLTHELTHTLIEAGYSPSMLDLRTLQLSENRIFRFITSDCDLAVIDLDDHFPLDTLKKLSVRHFVFLNRYGIPILLEGCRILGDYEEGGYQALNFMGEHNCRRIVVLGCKVPGPSSEIFDFYRGITRASNESQFESIQYFNTDEESFMKTIEPLLLERKIDGIISFPDYRVIPVLKMMKQMKIDPDTIKTVGYHNTPWSEAYHFSSFSPTGKKCFLY